MPGMTLRYTCTGDAGGDVSGNARNDRVRRALERAIVLGHHETTLYHMSERFVSGAVTYDGYPTHAFTVDDACVLFEGRIYAEDAIAEVAHAVEHHHR